MNFKYLLLLAILLFTTASASYEECIDQCNECLKDCKNPGHVHGIDCSSERAKCAAYCFNLGHSSCSPITLLKDKVISLFTSVSDSIEECLAQCIGCLKDCKYPGHAHGIDCSSERAKCSTYCYNLGHPSCYPKQF